ncbi:hypothetical protein [Burkholderia pseudomallei]|uniref:hypothetical protein n=1 Tax=Burkholderia pseudomallei TaxID=28450 RepID=UPI000AFBDD88|nr:hypothetical protein [Burkholderia pseudomallei]
MITFGEPLVALFDGSAVRNIQVGAPCYRRAAGTPRSITAALPPARDGPAPPLHDADRAAPEAIRRDARPDGAFPSIPDIPDLARAMSESATGHSPACAIRKRRYPVVVIHRIRAD